MTSVEQMRRFLLVCAATACVFLVSSPSAVLGETTTTTVPGTTTTVVLLTTTTSTTTSSLPSAVTTVPEGCALPQSAQAVFVGTVTAKDVSTATFTVTQVRAGSLEGYIDTTNTVEVRYGRDVKYLNKGESYIVGVQQDQVTLKLASTVRDSAELFGGAEVAGSNTKCPEYEEAARTLHVDGTAINSGLFVKLFEQPWRIAASFLVPPALVLFGLVGLVWLRRGTRIQNSGTKPQRKK